MNKTPFPSQMIGGIISRRISSASPSGDVLLRGLFNPILTKILSLHFYFHPTYRNPTPIT